MTATRREISTWWAAREYPTRRHRGRECCSSAEQLDSQAEPRRGLVWSYDGDASGSNMMDELYDVAVEDNTLRGRRHFTSSSGMNILAQYDLTPSTYPRWSGLHRERLRKR